MRGIHCFRVLGLALAIMIAIPALASGKVLTCFRLFEDRGPNLRFELLGIKRDPTGARLKTLKIAHYSLYRFDLFTIEPRKRTPFANFAAIIRTILHERPDVLTLSEVMNRESLVELGRQLGNIYEPIYVDGNDLGSIAMLIRKTLPLSVEVESHRGLKHTYFERVVPLFSRDLLLFHLLIPGETQPLITLGASHFKAPKSNFSLDPAFRRKRSDQENGAVSILNASRISRPARAQIFIGDMNADVRLRTEMRAIKAAGFQDALDALGLPMERRSTHSLFQFDGTPSYWQTDAAFISAEIIYRNALLSGYVAADRGVRNEALSKPRNLSEMRTRGSDHRMLTFEIDVSKLR